MYPLSINLAGAKDERGEVSRGSNACADCLAGFASWEVLPTIVYLCWTICKSQRCGQSCVSFWCCSASLRLFRSRLQGCACFSVLETQGAVLQSNFQLFSFHPGKIPLAPLCCISLNGLSLLSWEQVGCLADRWRAGTPCPACSVSSQLAQGHSPVEGTAGLSRSHCHELI